MELDFGLSHSSAHKFIAIARGNNEPATLHALAREPPKETASVFRRIPAKITTKLFEFQIRCVLRCSDFVVITSTRDNAQQRYHSLSFIQHKKILWKTLLHTARKHQYAVRWHGGKSPNRLRCYVKSKGDRYRASRQTHDCQDTRVVPSSAEGRIRLRSYVDACRCACVLCNSRSCAKTRPTRVKRSLATEACASRCKRPSL